MSKKYLNFLTAAAVFTIFNNSFSMQPMEPAADPSIVSHVEGAREEQSEIPIPSEGRSGAGILPFARSRRGIFFLFCVDFHRQTGSKNRRTGGVYEKDQHSDFGGSSEKTDRFFDDAAAREGYEETAGVISGTYKTPVELQEEGVANMRQRVREASEKGLYVKSIGDQRSFVTFFVDVTEMAKSEAERLIMLGRLYKYTGINLKKFGQKKYVEKVPTKDNPYATLCEKRKFGWFSLNQFKKAITGNGPFILHEPFRKNLERDLPADFFERLSAPE